MRASTRLQHHPACLADYIVVFCLFISETLLFTVANPVRNVTISCESEKERSEWVKDIQASIGKSAFELGSLNRGLLLIELVSA